MKFKNICPLKVNVNHKYKDSFTISNKDHKRSFNLYRFWTPEDWYDVDGYDEDALPKDALIYNPFTKSIQRSKAGRYPGLLFKIKDAICEPRKDFTRKFSQYPKHGIIYLPYAILLIPETFELYDAYMATSTTRYSIIYYKSFFIV